jgi:hypothetical protein
MEADPWTDVTRLRRELDAATDRALMTSAPANQGEESWLEVIRGLDVASASLGSAGPNLVPAEASSLPEGRWEGLGADGLVVELRIDLELGMVSCDLGFQGPAGVEWIAWARSRIQVSSMSMRLAAQDRGGATSTGSLELIPAGDTGLSGCLILDASLEGFAAGVPHDFVARCTGDEFRRIEVDWLCERGKAPPGSVEISGQPLDVAAVFRRNRLDLIERSADQVLPPPAGGVWGTAETFSALGESDFEILLNNELEAALAASGISPPHAPAFQIVAMVLGACSQSGIYGIMFDRTDALPRQAVAIFTDTIRNNEAQGGDPARRLLRTTVHELGHALNLAHRDERGVLGSFSFMTQPWAFRPGGLDAYWHGFELRFDLDELSLLRHGPRDQIIPGGSAFVGAEDWDDRQPRRPVPILPANRLRLSLEGPGGGAEAAAPVLLGFGAPLFLSVTLSAIDARGRPRPIPVLPHTLDPKGGSLEILWRRILPGRNISRLEPFRPMMHRCYHSPPARADDREGQGSPSARNLQVSFGRNGFPLAEPGNYEIQAALKVDDPIAGSGRILSNRLRVRAGHPRNRADEHEALDVFTATAGTWLALGGCRGLGQVGAKLDDIARRRLRDTSSASGPDGLALSILRASAIDMGRRYPGTGAVARTRSLHALQEFFEVPGVEQVFDTITLADTRRLAERYSKVLADMEKGDAGTGQAKAGSPRNKK